MKKYYKGIDYRTKEDRVNGLTFMNEGESWFIFAKRSNAWVRVGPGFMKDHPPQWRMEIAEDEVFLRIL